MLTAYAFLALNFTGYLLALWRGPFWGLLVYANIYFNAPQVHWWGGYLPISRWSLLSSAVLIVSLIIHREKVSKWKLSSISWAILFLILTSVITFTAAFEPHTANHNTYLLLTFCITAYCIVKSIKDKEQYRLFCLVIIAMAAKLSLNAYLYGRRIHARLENIGTSDTLGSNEFALLLIGIIPFTLPFIMRGKWYERIVCILSLPFLINAFILCNSRGAFVAFVLSIILAFAFISDKKIRRIIIIAVLCATSLFLYLADEYFFERVSSLYSTNGALRDDSGISRLSSGRTEIWMYGIKMIKDYPFGAGPDGFKQLARFYMPPEVLTFHPGAEHGIRAAHNTYLQVLVEQGYLGLCIFLVMCSHTMYLLFTAFNKLKRSDFGDLFWKYNIFALSLSYISILLGGLFNSRVYYEFFWWQIALSVVAYSLVKNMDGDGPENPNNLVHISQYHSKEKKKPNSVD